MVTIPPLAVATLLLGLILGLTAGFFFLVRRWSGREGDPGRDASEMLSGFRELHARGGLSDGEFRTIKTKLAPELQGEAGERVDAAPAPAEPIDET